ncbi:nucleotidyltransferase domain-containing protein [Sulfurimonas sp.]|uniref:nucleotidyltransferase family protein n=1 Tax=Sulfurimonas sp. TaxID=2022749 RepID=UPI0025D0A60D|nr:nucleotidyltransferase domain-containing protein [Sulfurimonas sp.]
MIDIEALKIEIVERLKPLNPQKIILFGSYAYGTPTEDSDIDLYVVTNDEFMPNNFKEKSQVYLKIARALQEILQKYPTDLITHTKAMHEKFKEMDSMFSRKILNEGIVIL